MQNAELGSLIENVSSAIEKQNRLSAAVNAAAAVALPVALCWAPTALNPTAPSRHPPLAPPPTATGPAENWNL